MQLTPSEVVKRQMDKSKDEFLKALPSHITFEKFQRTVMSALIADPGLLAADRQSLLASCVLAASDGLLPDKREAALVVYQCKVKQGNAEVWIDKVQYMPMFNGILKKVRQSKELLSVVTHPVYDKDEFEYTLGDDERITHKPYTGAEKRGLVKAAYCIVKLKDGTVMREVMTREDIDKVRDKSKAKDSQYGPWKNWYEEMARKSVFRRLAKWLPQSVDVSEAFAHDESMDILDEVKGSSPVTLENGADSVPAVDLHAVQALGHDPETGEVMETVSTDSGAPVRQPVLQAAINSQKDDSFPGDRK
jgi:recombination protein RecT